MLLFNDFLMKLIDILKRSEELFINSVFETDLKDFRLDVKYIASSNVVLPALFSPHIMVISLSNDILM